MGRYLKTDFYRMITSRQFYIGILGIAVLYYASGFQMLFQDVCASYILTKMLSVAILAYAFCVIPFSGCYVEDEENHFWHLAMQKGTVKKYVWSKVLVCFCSAMLAMVMGVILFALALNLRFPLVLDDSAVGIQLREADSFGFLLHGNTAILYFMASAWMNGLLGGIFALLSACLSLYEKNRLFTICAPIIGYYFFENFFTNTLHLPEAANLNVIFSSDLSIFQNSWMDIIYAVVIAVLALIGIGILTEKKIERELYGVEMEIGIRKCFSKHKK